VNKATYKAPLVNHILLTPDYPTRSRVVKTIVTEV